MLNSAGDTLCRGGSVRLFASGAYTYEWSPLRDWTMYSAVCLPLGGYHQGLSERMIKCFADTGFVFGKKYIPSPPLMPAGIKRSTPVRYWAQAGSITGYPRVMWVSAPGIVSTNGNSIIVKPRETTTYTAEAVNAGGCKSKDNVTVYVVLQWRQYFYPEIHFTPNGDGVNDIFYPRGSGVCSVSNPCAFTATGERWCMRNQSLFPMMSMQDGTAHLKGKLPAWWCICLHHWIMCDNNTVPIWRQYCIIKAIWFMYITMPAFDRHCCEYLSLVTSATYCCMASSFVFPFSGSPGFVFCLAHKIKHIGGCASNIYIPFSTLFCIMNTAAAMFHYLVLIAGVYCLQPLFKLFF